MPPSALSLSITCSLSGGLVTAYLTDYIHKYYPETGQKYYFLRGSEMCPSLIAKLMIGSGILVAGSVCFLFPGDGFSQLLYGGLFYASSWGWKWGERFRPWKKFWK